MSKIVMRQDHDLSEDEARQRVEALMDRFGEKYRFTARWTNERRATVSGRGVRGLVELGQKFVRMELSLPFFLLPLRTRIEQGMAREVSRALEAS